MAVARREPQAIQRVSQFTALVDILFATIGIFVVVFALQDPATTVALRPSPYDALVLCRPDGTIQLHRPDAAPRDFTVRDVAGPLATALEGEGRVLIGLSADCAGEMDGTVAADRLRAMVRGLSDRYADDDAPLNLFEFAPLGLGGHDADALLQRFGTVPRSVQ